MSSAIQVIAVNPLDPRSYLTRAKYKVQAQNAAIWAENTDLKGKRRHERASESICTKFNKPETPEEA